GDTWHGVAVQLFDFVGSALGDEMAEAGWKRRWQGGRGVEDQAAARALAASGVEHEAFLEERAAAREIVSQIIEDSGECLVLLDDQGKILEASRAAAMLLFPPWGRMDGTPLEKLFCPVAHDAVSEWRGRLPSPSGARAREKNVPPP